MNNILIIPAGGSGTRMGENLPKQFLKLHNKEIIIRTLEVFQNSDSIDKICISIGKDQKSKLLDLLDKYSINKVSEIVEGGKTRQESIYNALSTQIVQSSDNVLVHDAVRPFISEDLISRLLNQLVNFEAVIPVIPVSDTIKMIENEQIIDTPKREKLYSAQTPQAFKTKVLLEANEFVLKKSIKVTDDASIVEAYGIKVNTIIGDPKNIKITNPLDMKYAEMILRSFT